MPAKIIATPPEGELVRGNGGEIHPQPSFEVEWYDEQHNTTRREPINAGIARALAPELVQISLEEINWRQRLSEATYV